MNIFHFYKSKLLIITTALTVAAGIVFAVMVVLPQTQTKGPYIEEIEEEQIPETPQPGRAERLMKTLAQAYPRRIERAEFRNDDWAVLMGGTWYYYADGRLLPERLLDKASEYSSVGFISNYQKELPPWTEPSAETSARFRGTGAGRNSENTPRPQLQRSLFFHEGLWQSASREESSRRVKTVNFLGNAVTVHSDIVDVLSIIEQRIVNASKTDPQLELWIKNIGEMHGWNWRNVAGSSSRSNHSYGIAIDILPKSLEGKETYWQWAAQRGKDWWNIPYEDRYHPPDTVIKSFEAYGFIWGGKWAIFDTMHFEYRPEVFILSGLDLEIVR